jgi:DnaK suppressor protein
MAANTKAVSGDERRTLEQERAQTVTELERLRELIKDQPENNADAVDVDVYEREKNIALARRLETRIGEIDNALRAADKGTYGICERCGNAIDPERLKALPEATLCINCKNELEKQARA